MAELLSVRDLRVRFRRAAPGRYAVDGISFSMEEGEIMGLVGESGSGKTVTAMAVSGLLPQGQTEASGSATLGGQELLRCSEAQLRALQGSDLAVVFQEPMTSLDPVRRIGSQVEESLRAHTRLSAGERRRRALEAMVQAELPDPEGLCRKYPHELSGGMLQRVMIAAAIVSRPRLLLADEPTTALDVTIQAQILALLKKLNQENHMAILFISHDLHVVRKLCNRVAVMQRGRIVETGTAETLFQAPKEDYTRQLIAAIPTRDRRLLP